MTNGDWIRTLDDAKANELFGGWIPCEDWGEPGELIRDNDEELAKILSDYSTDLCKDSSTSISGGGIARHIK